MKSVVLLVLLPFVVFTQNNENRKDSIDLYITAIEKTSRYPLRGVAILNLNNDTLVLTDNNGNAIAKVLKETKYYKATHLGHIGIQFRPKRDHLFNRKIGSVVMRPMDTLQYGGEWEKKRQSVSLAINEIINGAIATRYIYNVNRKQAYGAHLSVYVFDLFKNSNQNENYKGFKLSTFYQYYLVNHLKTGIYLEPKFSFGYFDVNDIKYHGGEEEVIFRSDKFWTAGLGASIGFLFYISNSVVLGFSFGAQYFPIGAPRNITIDGVEYSRISNDIFYSGPPYWYTSGPGAIVDFKLYLGLKF